VGFCITSIERKELGQARPSGARIGSGLKYDRRTGEYLTDEIVGHETVAVLPEVEELIYYNQPERQKIVRRAQIMLGVEPDADADTIRKAFKKRSLETHPDKGGSQHEFINVKRAKEILDHWGPQK